MMCNYPLHFYRYRSLSGEAAVYVEKIVCHSELYFSKPLTFNDPFDCRPSFLFKASDKEKEQYCDNLHQKYNPDLNCEQRHQSVISMLKDWESGPEVYKQVQQLHTKRITEEIGVLCLSSVNDDILMWSHYADSHRGICLEFDSSSEFFKNACQVKYLSERPRINPFRQNEDEMMEAALLSKAGHWMYEQEWRLIHYKKGAGVYKFPPEALKSVILGAQISLSDKETVLGWIKNRTYPVKLYYSSPCNINFSLNIEEVKIDSKVS